MSLFPPASVGPKAPLAPPARPAAPAGVVAALAAFALLAAGCSDSDDPAGPGDGTPTLAPFRAAATCGACHPQHFAEWKRSMHAFAGSDPVMLALADRAAQEGGGSIANECMECHAPALVRQEKWLAGLPPGSSPEIEDLTQDGISCDFCHSVQRVPPVGDISWFDEIDPSAPKLGGIEDPMPNDFHESLYDDSYRTSIQCAPCHQIHLDDGTGLENTFDEWQDAILSGMGIECQDCHMPGYDGPAAIGGPTRRVHRHEFLGVDYFTTEFRGVDRAAQLAKVRDLLQNSVTVTPDFPASVAEGDTLRLAIEVHNNLTGHAIPSGTSFARDMWFDVTVRDGDGTEIYRSGWLEANGDVVSAATDPDLVTFGSVMYDEGGQPTQLTWKAVSIDESGLLQFGDRRDAEYAVPVPVATPGPLAVEVALRFRPMKPELIREAGVTELLPIEIFDMWSAAVDVAVTP